jgi:signal transduction histidine kinase
MTSGWQHADLLIHDSMKLAAHAITRVPVEVRLDLDKDIPVIWCHEGQMKQVIVNLVVNAVQAMPNGGRLTIGLHKESPQTLGIPAVRLAVSDSGIGIDPEFRSRMFDPFFTTKDDGTGLGLAIVYSIVEAHQGRIDVESMITHGSTFAIILPHPSTTKTAVTDQTSETMRSELSDGEPVGRGLALTEDWRHE